jgi:hypothetical protein
MKRREVEGVNDNARGIGCGGERGREKRRRKRIHKVVEKEGIAHNTGNQHCEDSHVYRLIKEYCNIGLHVLQNISPCHIPKIPIMLTKHDAVLKKTRELGS